MSGNTAASALQLGGGIGRRRSQAAPPPSDQRTLFRIPSDIAVSLGLRWGFVGDHPVDLDASCVAFDASGDCVDVVFFNNLKIPYMEHSGDNTTGEDGVEGEDDEAITIIMHKVPKEVCFLMVCVTSYTGTDFTTVESASCRLVNQATGEDVGEFQLGIVGHHTATLLCALTRIDPPPQDPNQMTCWDLRELNIPCRGRTFKDVLPKMQDMLGIGDSSKAQRSGTLPTYNLTKEKQSIPTVLAYIKLGLGWDGENDLDAAIVMIGKHGEYIDHLNAKLGKLKSLDGSAVHSGDKLNGYDLTGDDEEIAIDLSKVDPRVQTIFYLALLYDGQAKTFNEVPHGYASIRNKSNAADRLYHELTKFSLTKRGGESTAAIVLAVSRSDAVPQGTFRNGSGRWEVQMIEECTNGREYIDLFPVIRGVARHMSDLGNWKSFRDAAMIPYLLEVEFVQARGIGPLEPHQFSFHVEAWLMDRRKGKRFKSQCINDRNNLLVNETTEFEVNNFDCLRVMCYEHGFVGFVDVMLADVPWSATDDIEFEQSIERFMNTDGFRGWYPLSGHDVTGEICLGLTRKELPHHRRDSTASRGRGWCTIM